MLPMDYQAPQNRPVRPGSGLFIAGIIIAIFGGFGVAVESNNHSICDSTMGQIAQIDQHVHQTCLEENTVYYLAIVALVAGIALLVIGSYQLTRPVRLVPAQPLPGPGWYPSPNHPGYVRWWDGVQWTDQEHVPQAVPPPARPPPPAR